MIETARFDGADETAMLSVLPADAESGRRSFRRYLYLESNDGACATAAAELDL
jgi:hypothetical protein